MKIGTPLTPHATRVLLLGSGELGKELTLSLQRYGVEVIAVDRYANAPAHQVAHRSHVIDMRDPSEIKRIVALERPAYVVPEIEAIATDALVEIEALGETMVIPTAKAVQLTMNREGIRRLAAEDLKLPTSPYAFAYSLEELQEGAQQVGYPCFVKPVMSSSGKGQSRVIEASGIEAAWHYAQEGGRVKQGHVIVEGNIDFDYEITLLTVRALDTDGQITTQFCAPIGHRQVQGDYVESWQPQTMSPIARAESERIAKQITDHLGGRGIFGVELFVRGDQVWFSEVSPRPHDTGMVSMVTQAQNEFDLHARALLGLPVSTAQRSLGASAVIYGEIEAQGITFEGVEKALSIPETDIRLFGKPVSHVRRRMGVALAGGATVEEARERAKEAATRVKPFPSSN